MIRFASLGSGSKGNATLIESAQTRLLVDCGFSLAEVTKRLARLNCPPESIDAILVTHEHGDHANGVGRFSRKYQTPVYLTQGTFFAMKDAQFFQHVIFNLHQDFSINNFQITPIVAPHDAREPSQFIFSSDEKCLALLTDVGCYTSAIVSQLHKLDALMLECNYDLDMLSRGEYPSSLKRRVLSNYGHLDNQDALQLLKSIDTMKLQYVIGMHISENNNTQAHAMSVISQGLECVNTKVLLANQDEGFDWLTIN